MARNRAYAKSLVRQVIRELGPVEVTTVVACAEQDFTGPRDTIGNAVWEMLDEHELRLLADNRLELK